MNREQIRARLSAFRFFQKFELAPGVITNGQSPVETYTPHFDLPIDLHGKRVLDIGCNDGYFSFWAEQRGAQVMAIDILPRRAFFFAREVFESRVEFRQLSVYDILPSEIGHFDIVFFLGVYYHLKNPILALEHIAGLTRERLIVESEITPVQPHSVNSQASGEGISRFYEGDELAADPSNWWVPNVPCLLQTIRAAGFPRAELATCYLPSRAIVRAYKGTRTSSMPLTEDYMIVVDTPPSQSVVSGLVIVAGWALSQLDPRGGIERVVFYLDRLDDAAAYIGETIPNQPRPDLTVLLGDNYGMCGYQFEWGVQEITAGRHVLFVLAEGRRGWNYRMMAVEVR